MLHESGSLDAFLDATIARSRQIENTEMPDRNVITPADSPGSREFIGDDDPEGTYIDLDGDFIDECMNFESSADANANAIRNLIQRRAVNYKLSPDPRFATSPINIRDKDYDFSVDLSLISVVEDEPFRGTENESAVEHMNKLSSLSSLFSNDTKNTDTLLLKYFLSH